MRLSLLQRQSRACSFHLCCIISDKCFLRFWGLHQQVEWGISNGVPISVSALSKLKKKFGKWCGLLKSSNAMTNLEEEDRQGIWEPKWGRQKIQEKIRIEGLLGDQSQKMTHLFWPPSCIQMTRDVCVK